MLGDPYYNQFTFFKYPDSIEPPDFFLKDSFIFPWHWVRVFHVIKIPLTRNLQEERRYEATRARILLYVYYLMRPCVGRGV